MTPEIRRRIKTMRRRFATTWLPMLLAVGIVTCFVGFILQLAYAFESARDAGLRVLSTQFWNTLSPAGEWFKALASLVLGWIGQRAYVKFLDRQMVVSTSAMLSRFNDNKLQLDQMLAQRPKVFRSLHDWIAASDKLTESDDDNLLRYNYFTEGRVKDQAIEFTPLKVQEKAAIWFVLNMFDELVLRLSPFDGASEDLRKQRPFLEDEQEELRAACEWDAWQAYIVARLRCAPFMEVLCEDVNVYGSQFVRCVREALPDQFNRAIAAIERGKAEHGLRRFTL